MSDTLEGVGVLDPKLLPVAEQAERLHGIGVIIHDMYHSGQINEDVFHNMLIRLAKDWADVENLQEARNIVSGLSEKYLQEVMPRQMANEQNFHEIVHGLAQALAPSVASVDDSEIDLAILRGPTARA